MSALPPSEKLPFKHLLGKDQREISKLLKWVIQSFLESKIHDSDN